MLVVVFRGFGMLGLVKSFSHDFAENTSARFGVSSGRDNPPSTGLNFEEFDENEPVGDWPMASLQGACCGFRTNHDGILGSQCER